MALRGDDHRRFMAKYFHERPLHRNDKTAGFLTHVTVSPETIEALEYRITMHPFVENLEKASR